MDLFPNIRQLGRCNAHPSPGQFISSLKNTILNSLIAPRMMLVEREKLIASTGSGLHHSVIELLHLAGRVCSENEKTSSSRCKPAVNNNITEGIMSVINSN